MDPRSRWEDEQPRPKVQQRRRPLNRNLFAPRSDFYSAEDEVADPALAFAKVGLGLGALFFTGALCIALAAFLLFALWFAAACLGLL